MNYGQKWNDRVSFKKSGIDWRDGNQVFKLIPFLPISLSGSDWNCTIKLDDLLVSLSLYLYLSLNLSSPYDRRHRQDGNQVFESIAFLPITLSGSDCNCTIKPDANTAIPLFDKMGADSIVGMKQPLCLTLSYAWLWTLCINLQQHHILIRTGRINSWPSLFFF